MCCKFWGGFCTFMEPVPVSVIRDMAVCCIYRCDILLDLIILFLVDADCLGSRGQSQVVRCHSSCCLTSVLLDGSFLVFFEGHISLGDIGGQYYVWLQLNLISCLKFLVYRGSFWHLWNGSCVVQSSNLVLSKFTWCCASTKLANVVHVLASWFEASSHLLPSGQGHLSVMSLGSNSF